MLHKSNKYILIRTLGGETAEPVWLDVGSGKGVFTTCLQAAANDFFDFRVRSIGIDKDADLAATAKRFLVSLVEDGFNDQVMHSCLVEATA
jgi:hypothetical protein